MQNVKVNKFDLKERTKIFAIRIIKLVKSIPLTIEGKIISNQIIRSGTSVGANYRAACRARTKKEFIAKLGVVLEETDETLFWLELINEIKLIEPFLLEDILQEANELTAIFIKSIKSASNNN